MLTYRFVCEDVKQNWEEFTQHGEYLVLGQVGLDELGEDLHGSMNTI